MSSTAFREIPERKGLSETGDRVVRMAVG